MSEFRINQMVLVKFEAIPKALREQYRWDELSKFDDIYGGFDHGSHFYGVIKYESKTIPGSYYVDIPRIGLDASVRINEEDLSLFMFDLNKEPDTKGDKTKMGAYIPDNLLPKQIIYSNPATIVFWGDGTKTVVKVSDKENFNPYYGFCAALAKKVYGNNSLVNKIVGGGVYDTPKDKKKKKPQKDIPGKNSGTIPKQKTANKMDSYLNTIVNPFDIFSKEFDRIITHALDIRKEDKDND